MQYLMLTINCSKKIIGFVMSQPTLRVVHHKFSVHHYLFAYSYHGPGTLCSDYKFLIPAIRSLDQLPNDEGDNVAEIPIFDV